MIAKEAARGIALRLACGEETVRAVFCMLVSTIKWFGGREERNGCDGCDGLRRVARAGFTRSCWLRSNDVDDIVLTYTCLVKMD